MNKKSVLAGLITATAVSTASASINPIIEKQQQEKMMNSLLNGVTTVMSHPECTIKGPIKK